jgi:spermidine synthase
MALLWSQQAGATRYEVRTAGNTLRLYTDGVFHSQYNPTNPITGSVWDLLFLPAFFYPPQRIKRVLVLGVGGGAVIRQLLHFVDPDEIVGVELNPIHLKVAKKYFGLRGKKITLIKADAVQWSRDYRGVRFDLIIDDIFAEQNGTPARAVLADVKWFNSLIKHLNPSGVLVSNFISSREMKQCAYFTEPKLRQKFASAYQLTTPATENSVGVFLKISAESSQLRNNIKSHPLLVRALKTKKLRYSIRRMSVG